MNFIKSNRLFLLLLLLISSCKKCYDCSNLCVRCIKTPYVNEACGGEEFLNNMTVSQWKDYKIAIGYTCIDQYKNEEVCGVSAKNEKETQYYLCEPK